MAAHDGLLGLIWRYGYLLREWRTPRAVDAANRVVVHATTSFDVGGTQTQIKHLCVWPSSRYRHEASEIFPELNFLYRRDVGLDRARYSAGGPLSRMLGRWVLVRNYRSSQILQIYKLARDFEAAGADIVVGWGHELCATTFVAAALARVPTIVFCIRTVNPRHYRWDPVYSARLLAAHRHMAPHVAATVVNSTLLRDDHAGWAGVKPDTIDVCANGIDIVPLSADAAARARAGIRAEQKIPDDAIVIVNVGRFSIEKGQQTLVEANRVLLDRGTPSPVFWLLCGDGATLAEVQNSAAAQGMTNMRFVGRTSHVREMLSASDIFVMPSDFEGMPNAMMEAMAAGLPCVSTTVSGARDVARDGIEALYCEPRDHQQLAAQLMRLIADRDEAHRMGRAAAARIQEFSVERFVNCCEAVLDRVRAVS